MLLATDELVESASEEAVSVTAVRQTIGAFAEGATSIDVDGNEQTAEEQAGTQESAQRIHGASDPDRDRATSIDLDGNEQAAEEQAGGKKPETAQRLSKLKLFGGTVLQASSTVATTIGSGTLSMASSAATNTKSLGRLIGSKMETALLGERPEIYHERMAEDRYHTLKVLKDAIAGVLLLQFGPGPAEQWSTIQLGKQLDARGTVQEMLNGFKATGKIDMDGRHKQVEQLLLATEHCVFHGLRLVPAAGSDGNSRIPKSSTESNFWAMLEEWQDARVQKSGDVYESIQDVCELNHVDTARGKAKAWIRLALNQGLLEDSISLFSRSPGLLQMYYTSHALLRCPKGSNILLSQLCALSGPICGFQVDVDNALLDTTEPPEPEPEVDVEDNGEAVQSDGNGNESLAELKARVGQRMFSFGAAAKSKLGSSKEYASVRLKKGLW
jgi:hypothetical protein